MEKENDVQGTFDEAEWWKDRWIRKPHFSCAKEETYSLIQEALDRVLTVVLNFPLPGFSFLDMGCGRGEVLRYVKNKYGYNVTGVDIGESPIEELKEEGFNVFCDDIRTMNLLSKYQIIFSAFVSQHMISEEDFKNFYESMLRHAKFRSIIILIDKFKRMDVRGELDVNRKARDFGEHEVYWKKYNLKEIDRFLLGEDPTKHVVSLRVTRKPNV